MQARGSQLERAALACKQAVVSHSCAKKELGASILRSHVEARMPSPQLAAHPGMGGRAVMALCNPWGRSPVPEEGS